MHAIQGHHPNFKPPKKTLDRGVKRAYTLFGFEGQAFVGSYQKAAKASFRRLSRFFCLYGRPHPAAKTVIQCRAALREGDPGLIEGSGHVQKERR